MVYVGSVGMENIWLCSFSYANLREIGGCKKRQRIVQKNCQHFCV